jgi:hypothetical protein
MPSPSQISLVDAFQEKILTNSIRKLYVRQTFHHTLLAKLLQVAVVEVTKYFMPLLAQGQTLGFNAQERTNKTLTTGPFGNTCEADEVSPEVEAGVVSGLKCLKP